MRDKCSRDHENSQQSPDERLPAGEADALDIFTGNRCR
jgi:hypothetical protein